MRYLLLGMLVSMLATVALAQDNNEAVDKTDLLDDPQTLLQGGGGLTVDTAVLIYFGEYEDRQQAISVLLGMVERLRASGDPRVAPALAAVLNREGVYHRVTPYTGEGQIYTQQSRIIRFHLVEPATNAWFELMWPHLDEQQRVDAVLNTMRPDPDIHLMMTDQVMALAKQIEEPLRKAFYARLLNPDIQYDWRSAWMGKVNVGAGRLMLAFPPTQAERDEILASARTFPRLLYLELYGSPDEPWAIDLFKQLMEENKDRHVVLNAVSGYASRVAREPENVKDQYRPILIEYIDQMLQNLEDNRIDYWSLGIIFNIADTLFKYGKHDDTLALFIKLREFFDTYDPQKQELPGRLKQALPPNINAEMQGIDFRINMWTKDQNQ